MTTIRQILGIKGGEIWSVTPDETVYNAIRLMAEKNVGALMVLEGDHMRGIVSERDYARKVILKGKSSKETHVKEIMTSELITIGPDQSIEECMGLMTHKHIRHLPVVDNEKLMGVISIGDVVKAIISEKELTIKHLENYITGGR